LYKLQGGGNLRANRPGTAKYKGPGFLRLGPITQGLLTCKAGHLLVVRGLQMELVRVVLRLRVSAMRCFKTSGPKASDR
jgi:hypothetical protein